MQPAFDLLSSDEVQDASNLELATPKRRLRPCQLSSAWANIRLLGSMQTIRFRYRHSHAPELFLGAFISQNGQKRTLIGYVDGTLSPSPTLTHESMSTHVPGSRSVCIHGVCVDSSYRHRGIATALLKEYLRRLEGANKESGETKYERALLIVHEDIRAFYEGAGFEWVGKSDVVHGSKPWYEMRWVAPEQPQQIPAGVWEALQNQSASSSGAPSGNLLHAFSGGLLDVVDKEDGDARNKYPLLCVSCGSLILLKGVGVLKERENMEPPDHTHPHLPPLTPPPGKVSWWLVTPSPMAFENIGFSNPVNTGAASAGFPLKLLACGECDLGPVGWCEPGGKEFWLACERVAYRI
ncbi:Mss4-like protein [Auriscalpium vulgare]|uniref:Mss4-like protein n=1 Tax=Auriscalpium vulgare TaxID=40419 RepID=A0ACB8S6S2_9AGAM|nr:Mss4-like protein [Auriscalpium vulgare]